MSDFQDTLDKLLSDPEQLEKLAGIAKALVPPGEARADEAGSGGAPPSAESWLSALDPKTIGLIGRLMGEYNAKNDKEALLRALTPYLKETRRGKIEQAAKMAKLARLARLALTELGATGESAL